MHLGKVFSEKGSIMYRNVDFFVVSLTTTAVNLFFSLVLLLLIFFLIPRKAKVLDC